jgi:hypothetical protein
MCVHDYTAAAFRESCDPIFEEVVASLDKWWDGVEIVAKELQ